MRIAMSVFSRSRVEDTALIASTGLLILSMLMSSNPRAPLNHVDVEGFDQPKTLSRTSAIFFFAAALYAVFVSA